MHLYGSGRFEHSFCILERAFGIGIHMIILINEEFNMILC